MFFYLIALLIEPDSLREKAIPQSASARSDAAETSPWGQQREQSVGRVAGVFDNQSYSVSMCLCKNNYVYESQKQKWTVCEPFIIFKEKSDKKSWEYFFVTGYVYT